MSDRPIIFSGPMVRALLEGRKTQTRRLANVKWKDGANHDFSGWRPERVGKAHWQLIGGMGVGANIATVYAPADRLWVRESIDRVSEPGSVHYRADFDARGGDSSGLGWRPSIHMPRWASRLTLTVTDVRVQRLQEISEDDAAAEGCRPFFDNDNPEMMGRDRDIPMAPLRGPVDAFARLWNSLHGPDAWDANPWVAALTFTVRKGNIDAESRHD